MVRHSLQFEMTSAWWRNGLAIFVCVLGVIVVAGVTLWFLMRSQGARFVIPAVPAAVTYANPYSSPQKFMEGIYAAEKNITAPQDYQIRAVIVPHHLTATYSIASSMKMLEHQRFSKILLLSPDHFHRCPKLFCTVNSAYETFFGTSRAWPDTVQTLLTSSFVTEDEELFKNEHGIYAVVPYITHYFPQVSVTPLVLSQRLPWRTDNHALLDIINRVVDDDTVLVVSSDFSHYLPLETADRMDEHAAEAIFTKNLNGIAQLKNPDHSDCPSCLWLLTSLAEMRDFYNPSVVLHTNSARILKDLNIPRTTSHFSMVWYENMRLDANDLAIGGDVTFTRLDQVPVVAENVQQWWAGSGLRLLNLEGPLAEKCTPRHNPYLFCNPRALWLDIKDLATHWGVMNNHMLDRGLGGLTETIQIISASGKLPVTTVPWDNGRVRLIALTSIVNPVAVARAANLQASEASVINELRIPRPNELTVVFVHGGEEYRALTNDIQEAAYERLIDAGADAVAVSHSHVVGDVRLYKNKPIFRGVGNFLFDQADQISTATVKMVRLRKVGDHVLFQTMVTPMF